MRKRLKRKLCCCAMCKGHKRAKACRWKVKELDKLQRQERECAAVRGRCNHIMFDDCNEFKET